MRKEETLSIQEAVVMEQIPVNFGESHLLQRKAGKLMLMRKAELRDLIKAAQTIARPKAMYRPVAIQTPRANTVVMMGHTISNTVMHANLQGLKRAFVYIATSGAELAEWKASFSGAVERFFADLICETALSTASQALRAHITRAYHTHELASMNPGSTRGWGLEGQQVIFSILPEAQERIVVELLESFFMVPTHSSSGILFESVKGFENCQLCGLKNCPNRNVPFDERTLQHALAGK